MKFVDYSPYCGMSNSPISIIDVDGRDIILFFYSQRTSASGAGHVAVAVGQNDKRLSYFTHYPVHENAPGGANIVGQISLTGAMNYDKEKGLQTSGPALTIRIKTDNDADIDAKVAMVMMLQNNWNAFTANCSDGANAACSSVGIQPAIKRESHISSPAVVAFSLIEKMKTDSRISIISGDAKKFKEENLASATMSVGFTSLYKLTDAVYYASKSVINKVSNTIKETIDNGNNLVKDVKNKTEEGVKSLDKIGKP